MENLQGGLDYLKRVVIEDSLGIAADMEKEIRLVIDSYACEWRQTIESPEKLKRFRTFINSEKSDATVVFVEERQQIRPATVKEKEEIIQFKKSA
jgi:nitrite reductase (NADH) large subunit